MGQGVRITSAPLFVPFMKMKTGDPVNSFRNIFLTMKDFAILPFHSISVPGRWNLTRNMDKSEALALFKKTGALLEEHFILRSGLHSGHYFQCALALQQMSIVERLGAALADKIRFLRPKTIISPAMGGLVIGQEVAHQQQARFTFVGKEDGKLALRRGFNIPRKNLIVEDVVTQGGRVKETIDIVRQHKGNLLGVAMIVDRSNGSAQFGVPTFNLFQISVETFRDEAFPPDLAAIPPVKLGSK